MIDFAFDITRREIIIDQLTGAIAITDNPSTQNGGILLNSRTVNLNQPMFGIGLEQLINGPAKNATEQMNRWKSQAILDGATLAKWAGTQDGPQITENIQISYI